MADSAPDPNFEDVLSSVRRLVSQELPRRPASKPEPDPGALVLTSAQRIEETHTAVLEKRSLEQRIAELEAAVDNAPSQDFEPDGSEDQAQHRPDRIVYTRPPKAEEDDGGDRSKLRLSEIALIETGPAEEDESLSAAPVAFRHGRTESRSIEAEAEAPKPEAEAPMAEDVPTIPPARADVMAFTNPDDVVARIEARMDRGADETPGTQVHSGTNPASGGPNQSENILRPDEPEGAEGDEMTVEDFDAALTAAVRASLAEDERLKALAEQKAEAGAATKTAKEPRPATPATDAPSAEVKVTETPEAAPTAAPEPAFDPSREFYTGAPDDVGVEATDEAAPVVEQAGEKQTDSSEPKISEATEDEKAAPATAEAALAAVSDEEALRLLVGRLIRDELQGELGERITRNVRKLVRKEILRALTARDLV